MEIIISIIALLFIWSVIKSIGKSKKLIKAINTIRMNALRNPDIYIKSLDKYSSEDEIKQSITTNIYIALVKLGHNVDDYIPGNWEATEAFNQTINEIYELTQKN
jgi:hypothetical protein